MKFKDLYRHICLISLFSVAISAMSAKLVRMENPLVDKTNTAQLFIDAVELTPDSTTVTMHTYCYMGNNINIQPSVKLVHKGKSYSLRCANGIELGKNIDLPVLSDTIFTLSFEPLPIKTKTFDFIVGENESDFKLEGVHTDMTVDSHTPLELLKELPTQKWEKGNAVLKGKILNYQPDEEQTLVTVTPHSALGRLIDKKIGIASVNSEGSFEVIIPLIQSYQACYLNTPVFYGVIQAQAQDIKGKFAVSGYSSYIEIGKDGTIANSGFLHGLENIKKLLDDEIAR